MKNVFITGQTVSNSQQSIPRLPFKPSAVPFQQPQYTFAAAFRQSATYQLSSLPGTKPYTLSLTQQDNGHGSCLLQAARQYFYAPSAK